MSKGSAPRPFSDRKTFEDNWDKIFAKVVEIDDEPEDEICSWCSGSGEGMYDGATCKKCHVSGVEPVEKDDEV